jgi:cytochrome c peroxidase
MLGRSALRVVPCGRRAIRQLATGGHAKPMNLRVMMGVATGVGAATVAYKLKSVLAEQKKTDWAQLRKDLEEWMDIEDFDDGSFAPICIRLAWHSAGTWDPKTQTGGSDGATMRFSPEADHGANAGLHVARNRIREIKAKYPDVTYADLYVLAGLVAVEAMGGPRIPFRPGRSDVRGPATPHEDKRFSPDGRLPDAAIQKAAHYRDVFRDRMGFTDQEIVALLGAHSVGRCHTTSSGFDGPWTRSPTTFSNQYFKELLETKWTEKKWKGPRQFEDPTGELMMLPSDIALIEDAEFKKWVEVYAKDQGRFFKDFSSAFKKLTELGVNFPKSESSGWFSWLWGGKSEYV